MAGPPGTDPSSTTRRPRGMRGRGLRRVGGARYRRVNYGALYWSGSAISRFGDLRRRRAGAAR